MGVVVNHGKRGLPSDQDERRRDIRERLKRGIMDVT